MRCFTIKIFVFKKKNKNNPKPVSELWCVSCGPDTSLRAAGVPVSMALDTAAANFAPPTCTASWGMGSRRLGLSLPLTRCLVDKLLSPSEPQFALSAEWDE